MHILFVVVPVVPVPLDNIYIKKFIYYLFVPVVPVPLDLLSLFILLRRKNFFLIN
jgi:hypothetical protein